MRFRLPALAAALLLAACGSSLARSSSRSATVASSSTSAAPAIGVPCGPLGARTLAKGTTARVYVSGSKVFGCSSRTHAHASYLLGSARNCNAGAKVGLAIVSGDMTAYGLQRCGVDFGTATVNVRRLTDGKLLRSFAATRTGLPEAFQSVTSLRMKSNGAVAWIGTVSSVIGHGRATEVHKADAGRATVLLDSGPSIVATSLDLRGSRLTWTHGSATRSATLS